MAASFTSLNSQFHVRSVSLPTRLHPHSTKIEAELNKLKAWEMSITPTVPLSAETIRIGLVGLTELYNCVEELIHSQHPQQALLQHQHDQILVEEALEESVELLDACSSVKDLYLTTKERLQDLQSALRRNAGDIISIESNINAYMCCKKRVTKQTMKCLRSLKQIGNKTVSSSSHLLDTNHCLSMVIRVLREVTSVTVSVLRSLLLFLSVPSSKTKPVNGWSLISKLMLGKPAASSEIFNEVGSVDGALRYLCACIRRDDAKVDVKMASLGRMQALDASIEGFEAGLDCLFRRLIQNRVFLLNILAQ